MKAELSSVGLFRVVRVCCIIAIELYLNETIIAEVTETSTTDAEFMLVNLASHVTQEITAIDIW